MVRWHMNKLQYKIKSILCKSCINFEDTGLKDYMIYSKKGKVISKIQVRYYCRKYMEYLTRFYSGCKYYE